MQVKVRQLARVQSRHEKQWLMRLRELIQKMTSPFLLSNVFIVQSIEHLSWGLSSSM